MIGEHDWRCAGAGHAGRHLPVWPSRGPTTRRSTIWRRSKRAAVPTELLVLGCGARSIFVPPDLRPALKGAGMALEVVDTGSACRIYNVLLAEGRRVAAALIPL